MPSSHESDPQAEPRPLDSARPDTPGATEPPAPDLTAELERIEDRYKRALADLDNYRKRAARETERRAEESREVVLRDWLDVVDSVERAVSAGPESPCYDGMRAVLEQMETVLARHGVTRSGAPGEPFDPERHEAVGVVATNGDVPDRAILEVARSGFTRGDRVLRPAQVIVARRS